MSVNVMPLEAHRHFRDRLCGGASLIGSFVKTPGIQPIEILALAGVDFVVIDQEHAPFGRRDLDTAVFAARAMGVASLVRSSSAAPEAILAALDCGATGLIIPHVATVEIAARIVDASRYRGSRGFSGSVRASNYGGDSMNDYLSAADALVTVIAQIEDQAALDDIDRIVATPGLDAILIGRGDLTVSLGESAPDSERVRKAVGAIARAAGEAGKSVCVFAVDIEEVCYFQVLGATAFVVSSDQGFLRMAASRAVKAFRDL